MAGPGGLGALVAIFLLFLLGIKKWIEASQPQYMPLQATPVDVVDSNASSVVE